MYNLKILAKALSDIAKKGNANKYKLCTLKSHIYIFYAGIALYPALNYMGLTIDNPDISISESTVNHIIDNITNEQKIYLTGCIYNDLTEFVDENGNKIYCQTKLLKDTECSKSSYYTYTEKKYICVYDDPAKNILYAVICPAVKKES